MILEIKEAKDGLNIVIDGRWAAYFPENCRDQAEFLVERVNAVVGDLFEQQS